MTGKSPQECLGMEDIRTEIDRSDRQIIALLGERAGYVHAAAAFKTSEDGAVSYTHLTLPTILRV